MAKPLPDKIERQIDKAGLPTAGAIPFEPKLDKDKRGRHIIRKETVAHGPKKGKRGMLISRGEYGSRTGRMQAIRTIGTSKRMGARGISVSIHKGIGSHSRAEELAK